jgi:hypothetical protein
LSAIRVMKGSACMHVSVRGLEEIGASASRGQQCEEKTDTSTAPSFGS